MTTQETRKAILDGSQFGNESAGWMVISKDLTIISNMNNEDWKINKFKDLTALSRRVTQLINRGY